MPGNPTQDIWGNAAASFSNHAVTNNTNAVLVPPPPTGGLVVVPTGATGYQQTLTVTLNQVIAGGLIDPNEYIVMSAGGQVPVSGVPFTGGATITLTLLQAVNYAAPVSVMYLGSSLVDLFNQPVPPFGPLLINNSTGAQSPGGFAGGLPNKIAARLIQKPGDMA